MAVARLKNFEPFGPKQRQSFRLVCLYDENDALVRERIAELQTAFAAEGSPPAIVALDGDSLSREPFGLADEIGAMSLFAERRFIRVTLGARATQELFANALPRLAGAADVLVVVDAGNDKRQEETVHLLSRDPSCLVVPCPADEPDALADHARRTLAEGGIVVDPATARELVDLVDGDRALLANELAKLLFFCERDTTLSASAMRAAVAEDKSLLLDEAAEHVLAGRTGAVIDATDRLTAANIDRAQLVGATLRKALWGHRSASGQQAASLRHSITRLNEAVRRARSSDPLASTRAEATLITLARHRK